MTKSKTPRRVFERLIIALIFVILAGLAVLLSQMSVPWVAIGVGIAGINMVFAGATWIVNSRIQKLLISQFRSLTNLTGRSLAIMADESLDDQDRADYALLADLARQIARDRGLDNLGTLDQDTRAALLRSVLDHMPVVAQLGPARRGPPAPPRLPLGEDEEFDKSDSALDRFKKYMYPIQGETDQREADQGETDQHEADQGETDQREA